MAEWREIDGFNQYEVSDDGRVRRTGITRGKRGRELKLWSSNTGYRQVGLCQGGAVSRFLVHRLVAMTFLGHPDGRQVDHINGKRDDNRLQNLRYATQSQNMAAAHGKRINKSSRFRGVSWNREKQAWSVYGAEDGKTKAIGTFKNEKEAASAYNEWASERYGEFADLNETEKFGWAAE